MSESNGEFSLDTFRADFDRKLNDEITVAETILRQRNQLRFSAAQQRTEMRDKLTPEAFSAFVQKLEKETNAALKSKEVVGQVAKDKLVGKQVEDLKTATQEMLDNCRNEQEANYFVKALLADREREKTAHGACRF